MAGFKALRDASISFENYCRQVSAELSSAKPFEPFEYAVAKKIQDVHLFTSKFRLLEAKSFADTPQVIEKRKSEETIVDYEEAVLSKIIEQSTVKAITQSHTVKNLLTTPNHKLKPEFMEKKEKIIEVLTKYSQNEKQLCFIEGVLERAESELLEAQRKWDKVVGQLRDTPKVTPNEVQLDGPMDKKLKSLTEKMELMRWMVVKLVTSRYDRDYDWLNDPHRRLRALAIARQRSDVYE